MTKQDPSGSYAYFTDGASPASDVLSDNYTSLTPGISEMDGAGDRFYLPDLQGNSRGLLNSSQAVTDGYDGANQLVSETGGGTYAPPNYAYTYDHNGNRLTQTVNGQPFQSFTYDPHDKLVSGTAGNETDGHDLNGNETSITLNGALYQMRWDDEDRLIGETLPNGTVDTFTYDGLGLRVGKTDSTGSYSYFCDGASPGSPVLSDGHVVYTPGLLENRGGTSRYYANDRLGNLWTVDPSSGKSQLTYEDNAAFGELVAGASGGTPFGFGGANGCQTDTDINFVLMGHRYYDSRQGRFISQDPAHAGGNWYAYAGNSPINFTDPTGLKQTEPDDDQTQQILAAIQMMRDMGFNTEADETQTMLKQGRLLVDDSNPSGEVAGSSTDLFHISRNTVTIFIYQQTFAPNFGTATPTARFGDNVGLSATLVHENLHALHQGAAFKALYPSAIEPHAYGKELRYLHALESSAKNPGQLAAIQAKIESLAIPTGPTFSDEVNHFAYNAYNGAFDALGYSNSDK